MENSNSVTNEKTASVYRHEPRSLEYFTENNDCGCSDCCDNCGCQSNGKTSAAEILFLLALWGLTHHPKKSCTPQNDKDQSGEPSG